MGKSGKDASKSGYDRLALSFKAMGGGLWDYDLQADELYCNDRWYEIMGLSPKRDRMKSISDLIAYLHPDDIAAATRVDTESALDILARDDRYHAEFRAIPADGIPRWIRSVACIVRDNADHLHAVGCITDITEFRVNGKEPTEWVASSNALSASSEITADLNDPLSKRERECLLWVSMGKTAWETASILQLSQRTVEYHLKNAIRKLDAANKIHAAVIAIRRGLL